MFFPRKFTLTVPAETVTSVSKAERAKEKILLTSTSNNQKKERISFHSISLSWLWLGAFKCPFCSFSFSASTCSHGWAFSRCCVQLRQGKRTEQIFGEKSLFHAGRHRNLCVDSCFIRTENGIAGLCKNGPCEQLGERGINNSAILKFSQGWGRVPVSCTCHCIGHEVVKVPPLKYHCVFLWFFCFVFLL